MSKIVVGMGTASNYGYPFAFFFSGGGGVYWFLFCFFLFFYTQNFMVKNFFHYKTNSHCPETPQNLKTVQDILKWPFNPNPDT